MKTKITVFFDYMSNYWVMTYVEDDIKNQIDLKCSKRNGHQEALAEARQFVGDVPLRVKG